MILLVPHFESYPYLDYIDRYEAICKQGPDICSTLPKFKIGPENQWLEYQFSFGEAYFQGLC